LSIIVDFSRIFSVPYLENPRCSREMAVGINPECKYLE
jgi:hypothetical protein